MPIGPTSRRRIRAVTAKVPLTLAAIPVYALTIRAEIRRIAREGEEKGYRGYALADARTSVNMGNVSSAVKLAVAPVEHAIARRLYRRRLITLPSKTAEVVVAMIAWDFTYYWWHRANHRSRVLWAVHSQHHSSEHFNLTTALRQGTPEISGLLFFPLVALLGVSPSVISVSGNINLLYQYFLHTEVIDRLPPAIEATLNTASHHRVHHGSNPQYLDKNYGGISILWDRVFGTFEPEDERVVYGLTKNIDTYVLGRAVTHEMRLLADDVRSARTWREALAYLLAPPGWAPADQRALEQAVAAPR